MFPIWAAATLFVTFAAMPTPGLAETAATGSEQIRVLLNTLAVVDIVGEIRTVIVADPEVADASVNSLHKLYLIGKKPGHTSLTVLDASGKTLLNASVMIAPDEQGVVTVNRGVNKETVLSCAPRCATISSQNSDTAPAASTPSTPPTSTGAAVPGLPAGAVGAAPPPYVPPPTAAHGG